ncbi:hypothetical protein AB0F13_26005 [Streptomyces sp. NPDC026206]|uniref:hypothetical protein n=1 Tax=Streptomyces sp. NPDC026206 TaxID=3157089 RepID=UPI003410A5F5
MNAMKLPRTTRLTGAAVAALVVTAGAVAVASPAAAKSHNVVIDKVTLGTPGPTPVEADLTYTCDTGSGLDLQVTVTGPARTGSAPAVAAATVLNKDLTCDYTPHTTHLKLRSLTGKAFAKGDRVWVSAGYPLKDGAILGSEKSVTL